MSEVKTSNSGVSGEISRLKTNGTATAAELREFLGSMRERSPQEVLGKVAESGLVRSTVLATFGMVIVLAICTVVPYAMWGPPESTKPETPVAESTDDKPAATDTASDDSEKPQNPADVLGIGETKVAPSDENPLDKGPDLDNLLDGVK